MKKKLLVALVVLCVMSFVSFAFADRNVSTKQGFSSNTLVKRGDWKLYRATFTATADGASFTIYDSLTAGAASNTNVKTEGSVAITNSGKNLSFVGKPIEGSTGLYLVIINCDVILEYE